MSTEPPPPPPSEPPSHSPFNGDTGPIENVDAAGFFKALFDFSFDTFITPKVVKIVYVIAAILIPLAWIIFTIAAFTQSAGYGLSILIFGAIGVIFYLAIVRMTLEFYLAIVRMSQDIHHRLPTR